MKPSTNSFFFFTLGATSVFLLILNDFGQFGIHMGSLMEHIKMMNIFKTQISIIKNFELKKTTTDILLPSKQSVTFLRLMFTSPFLLLVFNFQMSNV